MKTKPLGMTGVSVPVIGQGTWELERNDRGEVIRALRRGLDLGLTHIDTAEMYGSGKVEQLVGEAMAGRRREVFLASKVLPEHASYAGTLRACETSLRHLRTDHLDLYLLHWAGTHPLEETIRAFEQLRSEGKIRFYGVSNFDATEIEDAVALAGRGRIACNQVLYHLRERAIEHDVIPACERHGIAVVGYSPFGSGRFPSPRSSVGTVLAGIAKAHGATPRQVALAFLTRQEGLFTIPKAGQVRHVEENAGAADLTLSEADIRSLDQAFPRGPRPKALPVV
ncbi:MAG: aldo/keto reductase [Nitrospirales bacterium]